MKFTIKLLALLFGALMLANIANAETPREQLKQMVGQLQKSPSDDALREKIIKLAQNLKPAPAVPEEAERRMMRGTAALEGAKSAADYRDAAKEFEQATLAAPWYGDAYFNLGLTQDKAENYEAALRSLKLALLASPNDKEIKALIFKVEYRKEKASSPEVQAAKKKQQEQEERWAAEEMIRGLEGAIFARQGEADTKFFRVLGGRIEAVNKQQIITFPDGRSYSKYCLCGDGSLCDAPIGAEKVCSRSAPFVGRIANELNAIYEISTDGRVLIVINTTPDRSTSRYERQ